jgi:hypothetical protein
MHLSFGVLDVRSEYFAKECGLDCLLARLALHGLTTAASIYKSRDFPIMYAKNRHRAQGALQPKGLRRILVHANVPDEPPGFGMHYY